MMRSAEILSSMAPAMQVTNNRSSFRKSRLVCCAVCLFALGAGFEIVAGAAGDSASPKPAKPDRTAFTELLAAVEEYREQGYLDNARSLLEAKLETLPLADPNVAAGRIPLEKVLAEVKADIAKEQEEELRGLLAELPMVKDKFELERLRERLRTDIEKEEVKQNTALVVAIQQALQRSESGALAWLPEAIQEPVKVVQTTLLKVIQVAIEVGAYVAILVIGILFFHWLTRRGIALRLRDETGPENEREKANRELNVLMGHEIGRIERGGVLGVEAGGLSDQAGTESTIGKVAELKGLIDNTPVQVGSFKFSPQQIFAVLTWAFARRPKYLLVGSLTKASGRLAISVTRHLPSGRPYRNEQYHSSATIGESNGQSETEAREKIVRDVAIQFAIRYAQRERQTSVVTQDWRSLRHYLEAEDLLRDCPREERKERREDALAALQQSLRDDPSNWMARYNAGIVFRRLGRHEEAANQFDYLGHMISAMDIARTDHYRAFREEQPDFGWMISYNLALSWAESGDWDYNQRACRRIEDLLEKAEHWTSERALRRLGSAATTQIEGLVGQVKHWRLERTQRRLRSAATRQGRPERPRDDNDKPNGKPEETGSHSADQLRLMALARSARAVAYVKSMELLRDKVAPGEEPEEELKKKMKDTCDKVDADEKWIWRMVNEVNAKKVSDWQAFTMAHSAAQSARGRAHYLIGDCKEAQRFLGWALSIHAPKAFAEPFVHMAAVILERKRDYEADWPREASAPLHLI
jgi:tetratricopeptide (TPR) repeat protein